MKKKIMCIAVIAIALIASWNIKQSKSEPNKMSNLAMANVEALATCERTAGSCWLKIGYQQERCCNIGDWGCSPCDD